MPWYIWLIFAIQAVTLALVVALKPKAADVKDTESQTEKIFQLYTQIEEMLDSFEAYVGEMHSGLEEKREELLDLNRQAQVIYMRVLENGSAQPAAPAPPPMPEPLAEPEPAAAPPPRKKPVQSVKPQKETPSRLTEMDREALGRFATKPQKVRFLMSQGLSLDEVAKELNIGKGEVILIADLDKS